MLEQMHLAIEQEILNETIVNLMGLQPQLDAIHKVKVERLNS
jgi:hypothetical protein